MDRNQNCFYKDVVMTKITVFKKGDKIWSYQVKGHSGYAEEGADIVCSAISTASQMTLLGLKEVLQLDVESSVNDGYLQVKLADGAENNNEAQVLLQTMVKTLEDITKNYAKYVKMEVRKDVY